jgi:hypothetical protein
VCKLVEEVEPFLRIDPQSENNDAEEGDSRRRATEDTQSDPEHEPKDHDDDDSSGEDDDCQDHDDTEFSSARPVSCPICNKQFKGPNAKGILKKHLDIHAPEPKYPCPHCPARFKQEQTRHKHIKIIHLKVKPVTVKKCACQFCAKKFANPSHKKEHEMVSNIATTNSTNLAILSY